MTLRLHLEASFERGVRRLLPRNYRQRITAKNYRQRITDGLWHTLALWAPPTPSRSAAGRTSRAERGRPRIVRDRLGSSYRTIRSRASCIYHAGDRPIVPKGTICLNLRGVMGNLSTIPPRLLVMGGATSYRPVWKALSQPWYPLNERVEISLARVHAHERLCRPATTFAPAPAPPTSAVLSHSPTPMICTPH